MSSTVTDYSALAHGVRDAMRALQKLPTSFRAKVLLAIAASLRSNIDSILVENKKDLDQATQTALDANLLARLKLTSAKIETLATGMEQIAAQEDPLNKVLRRTEISPGLVLEQRTSPLGVLLVIFESRPDALPQIAALSILAGDGVILKGGREAQHSNTALHNLVSAAVASEAVKQREELLKVGDIAGADACLLLGPLVSHVATRAEISALLAMDDCIDLVIPRGSSSLVKHVQNNTRIPVMGHSEGVCHVFLHSSADPSKAIRIAVDSKTDYPAACNAMETLLIDSANIPLGQQVCEALKAAGVSLRAGPKAAKVAALCNLCDGETGPDMHVEYGDLTATVEVVNDIAEAVAHVHRFGSGHTEAIVAEDPNACLLWQKAVDSACVFVNASTRFADGYRFGLGAEVGISTSRIHARGPVGAEGLTTTKWVLVSDAPPHLENGVVIPTAHTVSSFADKTFSYTHKDLLKREKE